MTLREKIEERDTILTQIAVEFGATEHTTALADLQSAIETVPVIERHDVMLAFAKQRYSDLKAAL